MTDILEAIIDEFMNCDMIPIINHNQGSKSCNKLVIGIDNNLSVTIYKKNTRIFHSKFVKLYELPENYNCMILIDKILLIFCNSYDNKNIDKCFENNYICVYYTPNKIEIFICNERLYEKYFLSNTFNNVHIYTKLFDMNLFLSCVNGILSLFYKL
jgi:hypothetical protein